VVIMPFTSTLSGSYFIWQPLYLAATLSGSHFIWQLTLKNEIPTNIYNLFSYIMAAILNNEKFSEMIT